MPMEVKITALVCATFMALFAAIAIGVNYSNMLDEKKVEACISANKIWAEGACVNNINELRYVDND